MFSALPIRFAITWLYENFGILFGQEFEHVHCVLLFGKVLKVATQEIMSDKLEMEEHDRLGQSLPPEAFYSMKTERLTSGQGYPSPLDRLRTGKRERAAQLGLTSRACEQSFDANQSFPKSTLTKHQEELSSTIKRDQLTVTGKGIHDVSFSRPTSRGSFGISPLPAADVVNHLNTSLDQSLNQSWIFYKYTSTPTAPSLPFDDTTTLCSPVNPNKAVVTINARTTEILMANDMACELFGHTDTDLIGQRLTKLINIKHRHQGALDELDVDPKTGDIVQISGRIMEASHSDGVSLSVSVWTSLIKSEAGDRCIVVMEPVQKIAATASISHSGRLLDCDESFVNLFGYQSKTELVDEVVNKVLPSVKLPNDGNELLEEHKKQTSTGLSKLGKSFPISLRISTSSQGQGCTIVVWVFTSISGLVTVSSSGTISAINENFSRFLCGYLPSDLIGKHISCLLPEIESNSLSAGELLDSGSIPLPPFDDEAHERDDFSGAKSNGTSAPLSRCDTDALIAEATASLAEVAITSTEYDRASTAELLSVEKDSVRNEEEVHEISNEVKCEACRLHRLNGSPREPGEILNCSHSPTRVSVDASPLAKGGTYSTLNSMDPLTSTPCRSSRMADKQPLNNSYSVQEGLYTGQVQHSNGSLLGVVIHAKNVELANGVKTNCLWISQDPEQLGEAAQQYVSLTLASSFSQSMNASSLAHTSATRAATESLNDTIEFPPANGLYRESYKTTLSVGKGAFGFVKLAQRRSDKVEFVVKFIKKSKVLKDCWVDDDALGRVSLEISLLSKLDHPNIVKLVEVFENEDYFQLVMQKHGSGIDLFEFIESNPKLDERLASFLFRQVVSAISFLHSNSILHRDIKDENIILNEQFEVKLIDFGSASYLQKGKMFSTFCGTVEYCSPEVLLGNKYRGPELEVWSMGVTLYTLTFGENPFYDVEETIEAILKPPFPVSPALMQLVQWMLHPDPLFRARVRDIVKHKWITQPVDINKYSWEEVLPNYEFKGNVAADNRPNPLQSSVDEENGEYSSSTDDDDVRQEMMKVLNDDVPQTLED